MSDDLQLKMKLDMFRLCIYVSARCLMEQGQMTDEAVLAMLANTMMAVRQLLFGQDATQARVAEDQINAGELEEHFQRVLHARNASGWN